MTSEKRRADALTEAERELLEHSCYFLQTHHSNAACQALRKLLIAASPVEQPTAAPSWLEWAVERWEAEVKNRPLTNVHRRALDDTWRQVIRHCGGDDVSLLGPRHDDLIAPAAAPIEGMERAFTSAAFGRRDELNLADRHAETPRLLALLGPKVIDGISSYDTRIEIERALSSAAAPSPADERAAYSIEGVVRFMRSEAEKQVCDCCPPGGGHIFSRRVEWDEWQTNHPAHFGNGPDVLIGSKVLDLNQNEGKRVRVTVEVLDEARAASASETVAEVARIADDMRAEQTYLGSCREACDNSGRIRWDRLQRMIDFFESRSPAIATEAVAYTHPDRLKRLADGKIQCETLWSKVLVEAGDIPLFTAPQPPAQADARVGLTDALRRAREELSIVEWENDPPSRVVKLFDEIDALLQGANHAQ